MKEKSIDLRQVPTSMKRVLFAFFFFSAWATPQLSADPVQGEEVILNEQSLQNKQTAVSGVVTDQSGEPLIGVSVKVKGATIGTATDIDGKFSLNVPSSSSVLELSYVGFLSQEVPVGSKTSFKIVLKDDSQMLEQVVVTAPIGVQRPPKEIGYSVSSISSKQLTESGSTNFASALYGKASGVKITAAPGGATSAVNVQIRGINSLNFNQQPLYVVDGVMIRNDSQNGSKGTNNGDYWSDQKIRGNGALDINPVDIESMTILKGASASALYGSDAASGVVVITTKKGSRNEGLGIELTYNGSLENVASVPKYQKKYGPGYDPGTNLSNGNIDGWLTDKDNSSINGGLRPWYSAYGQFGPRYDGRDVMWWDGTVRPYKAQKGNNLTKIFQTGFTSNLNLALSKQTDKINYRLSYTRLDYRGTQRGSEMQKNTFNLNSVVNIAKNLSLDVVANYINTNTHNRPENMDRIFNNYGGMINRAENIDHILDLYKTPLGYKYTSYGNRNNRPGEEHFIYNTNATTIMDYFWDRLRNNYDEVENRLITSATLNWDILPSKLKLRGRIGNDYTSANTESEKFTEQKSIYNVTESTGAYGVEKNQYSILYGDALLSYSDKFTDDFAFTLAAGWQGRQEEYKEQSTYTTRGLNSENWFSLNNSWGILDARSSRAEMLKYAYLGILNLSYKEMLFLEATARQEYASTLPVDNNHYFYWSTNASWIYSDAFKLPKWLTYGKIRASYGVVGNAPIRYLANVAFKQNSLQTVNNGSVPEYTMLNKYGNLDLTAEMKHEWEFGIEHRFWDDRISLDISYYTNKVKDQIVEVQAPLSSGGTSQLQNVGEVASQGLEIATSITPFIGDFRWTTRFNWAFNTSKVNSLAHGVNELTFIDEEQSSLKVSAKVGEKLGNIYVYDLKRTDDGKPLISADGYYQMDESKYIKVGNILPDIVGGWSNSFNYKNFSMDFTIDYRFGGKIISKGTKYSMGAGLLERTMAGRDAENGGLAWSYVGSDGKSYERNDGIMLDGINEKTGKQNDVIVSAADYYLNTFGWGKSAWNEKGMVFDNDYIKFREITIGYRVPDSAVRKLGMSNLRVSLYGKNLFYIYKTAKDIDPESSISSRWYSQGLDSGASLASRSFGFSVSTKF